MDRSKKLMLAISFGIAIIINFNFPSFAGFITASLILGAVFFGVSILIVKSVKIRREKKRDIKSFLLVMSTYIITSIVIIFVLFAYLIAQLFGLCIDLNHYRTNMFTGQCDFGGGSFIHPEDPWYYKSGCDSDEKKVRAIKNERYYDELFQLCKNSCDENNRTMFCNTTKRGSSIFRYVDMECSALVNCEKIDCSSPSHTSLVSK